MYDYLVVGAGLFGAVFAHEVAKKGKKVLVLDKRTTIAGNLFTKKDNNINIHKYGAHIFHTNNPKVWKYINNFAEFNRYTNCPLANYKSELYSLPFNMYTFNKLWGVLNPEDAKRIIDMQTREITSTPNNLEEKVISLVGRDIYIKLVKGYTEKQWGRDCKDLPTFLIERLPIRFTYDNNYFDSIYQGVPIGGYTKMVSNLLKGIDVVLNCDFLLNKNKWEAEAKRIVYTGAIDAYFEFSLGALEYRSLQFENTLLSTNNFQGNAVVNYTDIAIPWTRIIEHKWFEFGKDENGNDIEKTIITKEYPCEYKVGMERYYPINDAKNDFLFSKYAELAKTKKNILFCGRLGEYKYYDMDKTIEVALNCIDNELC